MGFGQYSAGGGIVRNKPELLSFATGDVAKSKMAGKNRLHFTRTDGSQGFILHETIVAELSADKTRLTLGDGGWYTLTTKSAWGDACKAFGFINTGVRKGYTIERGACCPFPMILDHAGEIVENDAYSYTYPDNTYSHTVTPSFPKRDERSVTYVVSRGEDGCPFFERDADVTPDFPMIRADVDCGGNFAVRFTGTEIVSEAGVRHKATPFKVLVVLLRVDALARATTKYHAFRGDALYQFSFEALGHTINPGQSSRSIMVGCHTFKTTEFRAMLKRIGAEHPDALKAAKRFVKKHPTDFGMAAYQAEQAARYARRVAA